MGLIEVKPYEEEIRGQVALLNGRQKCANLVHLGFVVTRE